ncbi:hypothetical protein [Microviridae sp.]|nr:hypothetical protein [Microviridae sp.]
MANVFLIQLISAKDGKRSEPLCADLDQLKELLRHVEDQNDKDYVLMVGVKPDDADFQITRTPLITIGDLKTSMLKNEGKQTNV